jgi:class 3 adenylate cyclase
VLIGTFFIVLGLWLLASALARPMGVALLVAGLFRFPVIWLEIRGHTTASALIGNFSAALLFAAGLVDIGAFTGAEVWVPVMIATPLLIMGPQHGRLRVIVPLINLAIVVIAEVVARRLPPYHPIPPDLLGPTQIVNLTAAVIMMATLVTAYRRLLDRAERRIVEERSLSERLLANILPSPIATRLKRGESPISDAHPAATIMFADIVNFTAVAAALPADVVVTMLNRLFQAFDDMVDRRGLEKIKTIGDAYMVAGGLDDRGDGAAAISDLGLEMLALVRDERHRDGVTLDLRVGIHTGPLVAGVIGKRKFSYDVWGDTVNTASRLTDASEPGRILISAATAASLGSRWRLVPCGPIDLKGIGHVSAYFLLGRSDAAETTGRRELLKSR